MPLKALIWQDEAGRTWLSYNDPAWLAAQHEIEAETQATITALAGVLDDLAKTASGL